jgi:DNA-binding response OmpR family regulator
MTMWLQPSSDGTPIAMVVEDDRDCRTLFEHALEHAGYTVIARADADDIVELVVRNRVNVILLDLSLPGTSGLDACASLKADRRTQRVPILVFSGHSSFESVRRATDAGADAYVVKPATPKRVVNVMQRLTGREEDRGGSLA